MSIFEQGVIVVEAYASSERDVGNVIQTSVSKAISQLNAEGKRVINISAGPSIKYLMGVNHLTHILWEKNCADESPYQATKRKPSNTVQSILDKSIDDNIQYDVILKCAGPEAIKVIKEIRAVNGMSLTELKQAIENCPTKIISGIAGKRVRELKAKIEELGGTVELRKGD